MENIVRSPTGKHYHRLASGRIRVVDGANRSYTTIGQMRRDLLRIVMSDTVASGGLAALAPTTAAQVHELSWALRHVASTVPGQPAL